MSTNLRYTSRDYPSIFEDLVNAIPSLTSVWNSREETDPGIVLIKLMSMLGDMLSYNQDMKALEIFPDSVTERKNAAQIFNLIGYKMNWYRSAMCYAILSNSYSLPAIIPPYTTFSTEDNSITYTTTESISIPASGSLAVTLTQGSPRTPIKLKSSSIDYNLSWYTEYDYNILYSDITNNRYYLSDIQIDQYSIRIYDSNNQEWKLVKDVELESSTIYCFEFDIDEYDRPYIKFNKYWNSNGNIDFRLFYIVTLGSKGGVTKGMLTNLTGRAYSTGSDGTSLININDYIKISNYSSMGGYDYESIPEARSNYKKYQNTLNTLVTLNDYRNATLRISGVENCVATDCFTDPDPSSLEANQVKLYITRSDYYEDTTTDSSKEAYIAMVKTELDQYNLVTKNILVDIDSIRYFYWTVTGTVYLNQPVDFDTSKDLITKINSNLSTIFSSANIDFNQAIKYIDVVNAIKSIDPLIYYIDLDQIEYHSKRSLSVDSVVSEKELNGKNKITIPYKENSTEYIVNLGQRIKPGTLIIKIDEGTSTLIDDGVGKIVSFDNSLSGNGSVDYDTGSINFDLVRTTHMNLEVSYTINTIGIAKYVNLNTLKFVIDSDSIKSN